jgi:hypothetical protein
MSGESSRMREVGDDESRNRWLVGSGRRQVRECHNTSYRPKYAEYMVAIVGDEGNQIRA